MRSILGGSCSIAIPTLRGLALAGLIASVVLPAGAAELAYPNRIEEGFLLWSSSAEYEAIWKSELPRDPWLLPDVIASTYDVGTRALRSGDAERAYRMWLPLAQAGNCRAKFAVGHLLDPTSPAALDTVTSEGRAIPSNERAAAAFAWYRSAAEEGWPAAQRRVGDAYAAGEVVPTDPDAAKLWYRRAARNRDPDAMIALSRALLHAGNPSEQVEGMTWALIAHDDRSLFWFDDNEAAALAADYERALPEEDVAAARRTAALWWPIDYAIMKGYDKDTLPNTDASRAMFGDLAPPDAPPAARFDAGAVAYLEGRHQDALLAWWPLARRGYCQAQSGGVGLLWSPGHVQPLQFPPPGESLPWGLARDTALAHAAMQGVVYAQVMAVFMFLPGDYYDPPIEQASGRWAERVAEQGEIQSIRNPFTYRREDGFP